MLKQFWKWLALFAYRHWAASEPPGRKPVGVPGNRDPDHPCVFYEPRPPRHGEWADCMSDGHHLCRECCHLDPRRASLLGWVDGGER